MSTSPSPAIESPERVDGAFPVETEIYILPDGRIVIADLPAELARPLSQLGPVLPCEISNHDILDSTS